MTQHYDQNPEQTEHVDKDTGEYLGTSDENQVEIRDVKTGRSLGTGSLEGVSDPFDDILNFSFKDVIKDMKAANVTDTIREQLAAKTEPEERRTWRNKFWSAVWTIFSFPVRAVKTALIWLFRVTRMQELWRRLKQVPIIGDCLEAAVTGLQVFGWMAYPVALIVVLANLATVSVPWAIFLLALAPIALPIMVVLTNPAMLAILVLGLLAAGLTINAVKGVIGFSTELPGQVIKGALGAKEEELAHA